ncbi:LTA synthase family protein [Paenibacillus sp. 3LSP]|uniref:LTA synthase family protein n=1 Tax=Paenibacillus sp. 3LSP TaxID=2800795 RepID=UPI0028FCFC42|nr:LTA synthase family protein [Paenibacillus sp. 3LSP]MDU0332799.1 LTA synthase family protein [Paenibacillus sp. 3LSP]
MKFISKRSCIPVIFALFVPFIMLLIVESVQRKDIIEVFKWIFDDFLIFSLNYFIYFFVQLLLIAVTSFLIGQIWFVSIFLLYSLAHYYKMYFLKEPLFPWDFLFVKQLFDLLPGLKINYFYIVGILIIFFLPIFLRKVIPQLRLKIIYRVLCIITSLTYLIIIGSWVKIQPINSMLNSKGIVNINWNQASNYTINGALLGFFSNIPSAVIIPPSDYNEDNINKIVKDFETKYKSDESELTPQLKPNIIYVMSESLWDPTVISNITLSKDPLPFYRSLIGKSTTGWLLSSEFGGGTANVEFEALTGLSTRFLPQGSIPYQQYVKKDYPSVAKILKNEGYQSIAIHSYVDWFWNRKFVYEKFDFDKFISENEFINPEKRGSYIADIEVSKKIIDEVESSEKPVFIYSITMQNHSPYTLETKYPSEIEIDGLSDALKETLEIYTQGVLEADQSLEYLIDYFTKSDEPTILVFYGDHLPNLGSVYNELQFEFSSDLEYKRLLGNTPLLIWDNMGNKNSEVINSISPNFLLPIVFKRAGLSLPLFYSFLDDFRSEVKGLTSNIVVEGDNTLLYELPSDLKEIENEYKLLQFDLLFGNKYSEKDLFYN